MRKIILAIVMMAFGASAAYACDGMKGQGHERADKSDQGAAKSAEDGNGAAKADQKS